jgi:pimeloyl-ACP methyl ester carboxylesterase
MTAAPIEGLWRENPSAAWDLRAAIACYPKLLLLALADGDEGINDVETLADVERDRSPNVSVVRFPGAGHNIHRTAFAELAGALDAWL